MKPVYLLIFAFFAVWIIYMYRTEDFEIPQNIVDPGNLDFGIEPPGAIADEGSFRTDMEDYLYGE